MSMGLYSVPDIYQTSWIEMKSSVRMRYEIDRDNDLATLFFGFRDEYVVCIGRQNLEQMLHLASAAHKELDIAHRPRSSATTRATSATTSSTGSASGEDLVV